MKTLDSKDKTALFKKENVIGIGHGMKVTKGKKTNKKCLTILVSKKLPLTELTAQDIIPNKINDMQTDVIEVGIIRALPVHKRATTRAADHIGKIRPAVGGISIGHKDITAGTFGCVVYRNNEPFILSNNHVLANSNAASLGDPILQPGPYDGGKLEDEIAKLEEFVEIKFAIAPPECSIANAALAVANFFTKLFKPHYTWQLARASSEVNYVDAAIAKPLSIDLVKDEILEIGSIKGTTQPEIDMKIQKSGRTTGYTTGTIMVLDTTVRVQYGLGKIAVFDNQIVAGPMSQGGDSGSAVLDMENNLLGLLFAGSDQTTIINPIDKVFELLNVSR